MLQGGGQPKKVLSPVAGEETGLALMRRAGIGDAAAFRQVADLYTPMIHGLAWRMLGDATEAEDVLQEAFIKLWIHAPGWTPTGGGIGGWLRRVATNACLDRLRKRRFLSDQAVPDQIDERPAADAVMDAARRQAAVTAAIKALPDRQRAAIVLTYYESVPNAEAAEILGIGIKALESLLVRARQGLGRSLTQKGMLREGEAA